MTWTGVCGQVGDHISHNVSVCGWWDSHHEVLAVTRRRGVAHGLGWWVERIDDPGYLRGLTRRILKTLNYSGPFELEFMWDRRDDAFKIIELNPRFWMQNLLVNEASDHALTRLALGMPCDSVGLSARPRHWLQPDVLVTRPLSAIAALPNATLAYPMRRVLGTAFRRMHTRIRRLVDGPS